MFERKFLRQRYPQAEDHHRHTGRRVEDLRGQADAVRAPRDFQLSPHIFHRGEREEEARDNRPASQQRLRQRAWFLHPRDPRSRGLQVRGAEGDR